MGDQASWFNYTRSGRRVHGRRLRSGGFRSADLNVAGWAAVLLPGLVLGLVASGLSGSPPYPLAVGGMILTWLVALGIDYLAWRRIR